MKEMPNYCPILEGTQFINEQSEDMIKTMQQMRRDLRECHKCPAYGKCTILYEFNDRVHIAIQEVVEEWQIKSGFGETNYVE